MLKLCLQCFVCFTISLRLLLLIHRLRSLWLQQRYGLASEFRQELRRRGLLAALPPGRGSG